MGSYGRAEGLTICVDMGGLEPDSSGGALFVNAAFMGVMCGRRAPPALTLPVFLVHRVCSPTTYATTGATDGLTAPCRHEQTITTVCTPKLGDGLEPCNYCKTQTSGNSYQTAPSAGAVPTPNSIIPWLSVCLHHYQPFSFWSIGRLGQWAGRTLASACLFWAATCGAMGLEQPDGRFRWADRPLWRANCQET